jgi:SSS family solute:Na+ symporter
VLITVISAIVMVVVSHLTQEPDYDRIRSLTFETVTPEDRAKTRASWTWREVAGSAVVLICIMGAYLYFRG